MKNSHNKNAIGNSNVDLDGSSPGWALCALGLFFMMLSMFILLAEQAGPSQVSTGVPS